MLPLVGMVAVDGERRMYQYPEVFLDVERDRRKLKNSVHIERMLVDSISINLSVRKARQDTIEVGGSRCSTRCSSIVKMMVIV